MNSKEWFRQAQFGMMVHFGLYSVIAGEWKGKRIPHIGEWSQSYFRIPNREYHELAKVFNPIYFNADEWIRLAKDAGMKYFVITSKHHDGFALFHSKASKFNVVDATPFGRDIIAELAESCYKYGIKLGLYYSQALDWAEPDGGGYDKTTMKQLNCDEMYWTNNWDYPDNEKKNYTKCFENKIKPQVQEILTGYGDLCLIWFDTPKTISPEQSLELYNMVKHYQPQCLVNSRIGNGLGDYRSSGDNEITIQNSDNILLEVPATLNDTWGYKAFDNNYKSPEKLLEIKHKLNSQGINYLLNVGPDYLGRIPAPAADILSKLI